MGMNAVDFVKKFGWLQAKNVLQGSEDFEEVSIYLPNDNFENPTVLNVEDLKTLVDAWELVESCGGYSAAEDYYNNGNMPTICRSVLARALVDVESCNA